MSRIDNNYFTYRETPTTENGTGTVVDIKGQTLKWNQLVYNGNFTSTDGWAGESGDPTLSVADNSITVTMTSGSPSVFNPAIKPSSIYPFVANHKYLFSFDFKATKAGVCLFYRSNAFVGGGLNFFPVLQSANTWKSYKNIVTATGTENFVGYFGLLYADDSGITVGDSFSLRNLMIFDLTALGIADKTNEEILQWFADYFPLSYYSYNQGSLLSFNGNGIKTVGKNQINYNSIEKGRIDSGNVGYVSDTTALYITGNDISFTTSLPYRGIVFDFVRVDGKPFAFGLVAEVQSNGTFYIDIYDAEKRWLERSTIRTVISTGTINRTITISEAVYVRASVQMGNATSCKLSNVYMGTDIDAFEPYTESVINLPISTYFPTGMKQVGNYDELTPSKATTRIGAVTFNGSENWYYDSNNRLFQCAVSGAIITNATTQYNVYTKNNRFEDKSWATRSDGSLGMYYGASFIFIKSTQFADVNALKTWLQSNPVTVYYELATPIETSISPELDLTFNIDKGGTEELLPSGLLNGSVDLGSLTWRYESGWRAFVSTIADAKRVTSSLNANWFCSRYSLKGSHFSGDSSADMTIDLNSTAHGDGTITIRDTSFNGDATAFTNSLQGVYLWYETTDSTPTTTPILCDILYRGLIPVSVTVYPLGAGTVEGAGQYRYGETVTLVAESSDGIYRFLRYEDENGDTLSTDATYSFIAGE